MLHPGSKRTVALGGLEQGQRYYTAT